MAIFSDLPNELILGIWGYVIEPNDVESFALVSKRIYGLSLQFVNEHASLKQQYSKIYFHYRKRNYEPAELLEKMLLDTRIAFYISSLEISHCKGSWGRQTTPQAYCKDTMALFEDAIRASALITGSEAEDWITEIREGNEDPIIALVIMRLIKIKEFNLWEPDRGGRYIFRTLERITQSPEAFVRPRQSISGTEINSDSQLTSTRPSMFFTVSYMKMASLHATFDMVSHLLRCMKGLKRFSYWRHRGSSFELSQLCDKLLECSQFSLQKLSIHGLNTGRGDITQFQILAEVATNFEVLLGKTDDTCKNLADVLPTSIESVKLTSAGETISFQVLRRVILDMIKCKMDRLPKLQELTFGFGDYQGEATTRNIELITELQGMSAKVGVLLSANREAVKGVRFRGGVSS